MSININIGSKKEDKKNFEIVIELKDKEGNPTGVKKYYQTDDSSKLHQFWTRNTGSIKKKKKRKSEAISNKEDIKQALKEVDTYTSKVRKQRNLED